MSAYIFLSSLSRVFALADFKLNLFSGFYLPFAGWNFLTIFWKDLNLYHFIAGYFVSLNAICHTNLSPIQFLLYRFHIIFISLDIVNMTSTWFNRIRNYILIITSFCYMTVAMWYEYCCTTHPEPVQPNSSGHKLSWLPEIVVNWIFGTFSFCFCTFCLLAGSFINYLLRWIILHCNIYIL